MSIPHGTYYSRRSKLIAVGLFGLLVIVSVRSAKAQTSVDPDSAFAVM